MAFASYLSKKPVQSVSQESLALERHYTVLEIAEMWSLSEKTVRRMFEQEDGVLQWEARRRAANAATSRCVFLRAYCYVCITSVS
jgi:hypothetical protein